MPLIRPFPGLRPLPDNAAEVAAPPYDVLDSNEARERAAGKPWSFLHISKPEIDLPPGVDPYDAAVYAKGKENFDKLLKEGVLRKDSAPCYYLYRLIMGAHQQTGLVAAAGVADYELGPYPQARVHPPRQGGRSRAPGGCAQCPDRAGVPYI